MKRHQQTVFQLTLFAALFAASACGPGKNEVTKNDADANRGSAAKAPAKATTQSWGGNQARPPVTEPVAAAEDSEKKAETPAPSAEIKDPVLREKVSRAAVMETFVHNGERFAKGPDGQPKMLLDPEQFATTQIPDSMKKYQLEERLKDSEFMRKLKLEAEPSGKSSFMRHLGLGSAYAIGKSQLRAATKISLQSFQTPVKNQGDRGTCWAFATTAAIEARYKRLKGLNLDLSEQYANAIAKSSHLGNPNATNGARENESSYWGGWHITLALGVYVDMPLPLETDAPYLMGGAMETLRKQIPAAGSLDTKTATQAQIDAFEYDTRYISENARARARYGNTDLILVTDSTKTDPETIENFLFLGYEVVWGGDVKWKSDKNGILQWDDKASGGGHAMLVVGYDRSDSDATKHHFIVKNSWGGTSNIKMHYDMMRKGTWSLAVATGARDESVPHTKSLWLGRWSTDHDGWRGQLIVRRAPPKGNSNTRLGHYLPSSGNPRAVNGYMNNDSRGLVFYLADTENAKAGVLAGQRFDPFMYSWEPKFASGYTHWNGIRFGLSMAKGFAFAQKPGSGFGLAQWPGTYAMNHDGWKGDLKITSVTPTKLFGVVIAVKVAGTYYPAGGGASAVTGSIDAQHNHVANLYIGGQPFTLAGHTREGGFLSGTATWAGQLYGAHALRK